MSAKNFQPQLQHFEQICKGAGLKVTHQRLEIYRELLGAHDHPSAEVLYKRLEKRLPSLSLDTVYRTLSTFEKLQLVHRVETVESQARFEALTSHHHHFLCDTCGQLVDFFWQDFDDMLLPSALAEVGSIDRTTVVVHGTCAACARKAERSDTNRAATAESPVPR
ncbi:Fur family transcriptional regulator [Desulfobulbus elongatus]|uniref:Fur family transcriptional regulator n=1 Tax=Desulfobulbus elongatus TaxID=53332 RepID=UPI000489DB97|nr:Fur family transcriptional regulator [Desulfobulbus elongatus]